MANFNGKGCGGMIFDRHKQKQIEEAESPRIRRRPIACLLPWNRRPQSTNRLKVERKENGDIIAKETGEILARTRAYGGWISGDDAQK